jgi:DNA-binding MarR family transcriptional regulator
MKQDGEPLARSQGLVVEELGEELLVYDLETDRAHSLYPEAAQVWRSCDGGTSVESLAARLELDAETVGRALDELEACDLLESAAPPAGGSTRRELTVRAVKAGALVAAAPLIVSVTAPSPASAVTPGQCAGFSSTTCGQGGPSVGCKGAGCCCCNGSFAGQPASFKFCVVDQAACLAIPGGQTCA